MSPDAETEVRCENCTTLVDGKRRFEKDGRVYCCKACYREEACDC